MSEDLIARLSLALGVVLVPTVLVLSYGVVVRRNREIPKANELPPAITVTYLVTVFAIVAAMLVYPPAAFVIFIAMLIWEFGMTARSPKGQKLVSMATWITKPTVDLPDTLELTSPLKRKGDHFETKIYLDGESWKAVLHDDGRPVPMVGDIVEVIERRGLEIRLATKDNDA